jgi:hypothetical protein
MDPKKRHFTVVDGNKEHGLYVSSSPSSAARKAVSKLCATDKNKKVKFNIREITQGSKKKTYGPYLGEMKKLAKPIELMGRVIKYKPEVVKLIEKKAIQKGGTEAIVIAGNGNPYKTIVFQYGCKFNELHIYFSIEGINVIPNDDDITYNQILTLNNLQVKMNSDEQKLFNFDKDYLLRVKIEKPLTVHIQRELYNICKRFGKEYSNVNVTSNSPEFNKLILSIKHLIC